MSIGPPPGETLKVTFAGWQGNVALFEVADDDAAEAHEYLKIGQEYVAHVTQHGHKQE